MVGVLLGRGQFRACFKREQSFYARCLVAFGSTHEKFPTIKQRNRSCATDGDVVFDRDSCLKKKAKVNK